MLMRLLALATLASLVFSLAACGSSPDLPSALSDSELNGLDGVPFAARADEDPFYAQPVSFVDTTPGTILKSREIDFHITTEAPAPQFRAWQLQYVSRDIHNRPIANVTTIAINRGTVVSSASPIVSYQYAYNSLGASCTPSRLFFGTGDNTTTEIEAGLWSLPATNLGWVMVFPDHQGPDHAYGVGRLAGRLILDSLRAAINFSEIGLSEENPIGFWGYSAGGLVTLSAASMRAQYAPELNALAAAAGGAAINMIDIAEEAQNTENFPLIFSLLIGINRVFSGLLPEGIFNDAGRTYIDSIKNGCSGGTTDGADQATGFFSDYMTIDEPFATSHFLQTREQIMLPFDDHVPDFELFMYHEIMDELVPVEPADDLVAEWCEAGVSIHYKRQTGGNHIGGAAAGGPDAGLFLQSRLANPAPPWAAQGAVSCN